MPAPIGPHSRVEVTPADLQSLAAQWRRQEWDLRSVGDALSNVPTGAVAAVGVGGFLAAWAREISDLAVAVGLLADGLQETGSELAAVDQTVADR